MKFLRKGFDGHNSFSALKRTLRNLLVSQDARHHQVRWKCPKQPKQKYQSQAPASSPSLLLSWLTGFKISATSILRLAENQRLSVELALMKMAHINSVSKSSDTALSTVGIKKMMAITG